MKCAIQWIDMNTAQTTPDTNEAIGLAEVTFVNKDGTTRREAFPICAEHAKRMPRHASVCEHYRSSWTLLPLTERK